MYNERNAHGARKIIYAFFIVFFIAVIVSFGKIIVDRLNVNGSLKKDEDTTAGKLQKNACENSQTRDALEKAGLGNYAPTKCK